MSSTTQSLPIHETMSPATPGEVVDAVRAAHDVAQPVYPIGGGTALDLGLVPTKQGVGLELAGLNQFVDYTPRDMTIVVEAGVRMADLAAALDVERQQLPIDAPQAAEATLGGLVATNWSGPRRFGHGTLRDYIIGINAVDGRGVPFKAGGRVVKNVAGYDFCKLLTGSLGTLAVITQLTFKVKPQSEGFVTVVADCADLAAADRMLDELVQAPTPPAAIDLQVGNQWSEILPTSAEPAITLAVRFEGTTEECHFMRDDLSTRLATAGGREIRVLEDAMADELLARQVGFPRLGAGQNSDESPLVIKMTSVPSAVPALLGMILEFDPAAQIGAQAGNGIIVARFASFDPAALTTQLVGRLRPAAIRHGGSLTVLASNFEGLTRPIVWGGRSESSQMMERIKQQFDPLGILNPGRFLF